MAYKPDKREDILRAAALVFSAAGYHAATTADIAIKAGLPPGSLYYHIGSKEELLFDVLMDGMKRAFNILQEIKRSTKRADERLSLAIARTIKANCDMEHPGMALNFAFILPGTLEPAHWRKYLAERDRYESAFRKMIQDGIDAGLFRPTNVVLETRHILAVMNWVRVWFRPSGSLTSDDVATWYAKRVMDGLLIQPARETVAANAALVGAAT